MSELTVEQMELLLVDATLRRSPRLLTDEALDFYARMMAQTAEIRAAGQEVEIPFN